MTRCADAIVEQTIMKRLLSTLLLFATCGLVPLFAQNSAPDASSAKKSAVQPYLTTDLTSAYLWRGQRLAGVSIQPVMGIKWKGLNVYAWGNAQVAPPAGQNPAKHEIDLFVKYQVAPWLNIGLKDVYVNTRGNGFLTWGHIGDASHGTDAIVAFTTRHFSAEWSTTILGHDGLNKHGKRSYSSYLLASLPFRISHVQFAALVGVVPYYTSRYDDLSSGFHVNMLSLKAVYNVPLSQRYELPVYSQLMVNPSNRRAYFQVGCKFKLF